MSDTPRTDAIEDRLNEGTESRNEADRIWNDLIALSRELERQLTDTLLLAAQWRDAHSRELNALRDALKKREPTMDEWELYG